MRDCFKNKEYFDKYIDTIYLGQEKRYKKIKADLIKPDRIGIVKSSMSYKYLTVLRAKYSRGDNMFSEKTLQDYNTCVNLLAEPSKEKGRHLLQYIQKKKAITLKQYTLQFHFDMIDMLSLGVLLNVSINIFNLLINKIDEDNVKDFLYEFLIKSRVKDRLSIEEENFQEFPWYKDRFKIIKDIITIEDKEIAQNELKAFLEKKWYHALHNTAGYNQHKKDNGNYTGYWCYVAAAIVKIKDLDDSSFRDNKYYPKDLL